MIETRRLIETANQLCPRCGSEDCHYHFPERYGNTLVFCASCAFTFAPMPVDVETQEP